MRDYPSMGEAMSNRDAGSYHVTLGDMLFHAMWQQMGKPLESACASGGPAYLRWTNGHLFEPSAMTRLRLFCFPYEGGGASIFREWASELPAGVEMRPIQLPGWESRWTEPAFTDLLSLVKSLADVL